MKNALYILLLTTIICYSCNRPTDGTCEENCYTFQGIAIDKLTGEQISNTPVELVCFFGGPLWGLERTVSEVSTDENGFFNLSVSASELEGGRSPRLIFNEPDDGEGTYERNRNPISYDSTDLNTVIGLGEIELYNYTRSKLVLNSEIPELFSVQISVEMTATNSGTGEKVVASSIGYGSTTLKNKKAVEHFFLFSDRINNITLSYKTSLQGTSRTQVLELFKERGNNEDIEFDIVE